MRRLRPEIHRTRTVLPPWFKRLKQGLVGCILLAVIAFGILFGWRMLKVWNIRNWYEAEPYRMLVLHGKKGSEPTAIELITIWPDTFKVVSLMIPPDLRISAVGGYGDYRIASLVDLGRVEKVGDRLLKDSMGFTFGIPIHQILWQTGNNIDFNNARGNLIKGGITGNQSLKEVAAILTIMGKITKTDVESIDLSKRNVITSTIDTDGSLSLTFERALLDHLMMDKLSAIWPDAAVTQVAIINASGKPQMASSWSRFPRIGGYDVVSVTDQQEIANQTRILFSGEGLKNGMVGKVLQNMFPRALIQVADTGEYRAPVAVVIGLDSWLWLNNREEYLKK